jgi:hypothetical protein
MRKKKKKGSPIRKSAADTASEPARRMRLRIHGFMRSLSRSIKEPER